VAVVVAVLHKLPLQQNTVVPTGVHVLPPLPLNVTGPVTAF